MVLDELSNNVLILDANIHLAEHTKSDVIDEENVKPEQEITK